MIYASSGWGVAPSFVCRIDVELVHLRPIGLRVVEVAAVELQRER